MPSLNGVISVLGDANTGQSSGLPLPTIWVPQPAQRTMAEWLAQFNAAANAGVNQFTTPLNVDEYSEILVFANIYGANANAAAGGGGATGTNLQVALQACDGSATLASQALNNTFIDLPAVAWGPSAPPISAPGVVPGVFLVGQYTNFGNLVRVRVNYAVAWTATANLDIRIKCKGKV